MIDEEIYSIKEIAQAAKVSKPTVSKTIGILGIEAAKKELNTKKTYYSRTDAETIISFLKTAKGENEESENLKNEPENPETEPEISEIEPENPKTESEKQQNKNQNANVDDTVYAIIEVLREQLAEKDRQIAQLQKSLDNALTITKQQQYLSLPAAADMADKQTIREDIIVNQDPTIIQQERKKNIFQRLFGRK